MAPRLQLVNNLFETHFSGILCSLLPQKLSPNAVIRLPAQAGQAGTKERTGQRGMDILGTARILV